MAGRRPRALSRLVGDRPPPRIPLTKQYRLLTPAGPQLSDTPGTLGGNGKAKIYGRLDCSAALAALPQGYAKLRVFFADEAAAIACGYRPCGSCMRKEYAAWKAAKAT